MTKFGVSAKLKEFVNDNFKSDENGKKVLQKGRKHCGEKEKLLVKSDFSFSPQCFQKNCTANT